MSLPVLRAKQGSVLPLRPQGDLLKGWIPGTIVNFVHSQDKRYMAMDLAVKFPHKSSNGGMFTISGSYELLPGYDRSFANQNEPSGLWTPDETVILAKNENNDILEFDKQDKMLSKFGEGVTTVNYDGGCFKLYTFQRYNNEYLSSNGASGDEIHWEQHVGQILGTSPRSLFTTHANNVIDELPSYRVGEYNQDDNGKWYLFIVRR